MLHGRQTGRTNGGGMKGKEKEGGDGRLRKLSVMTMVNCWQKKRACIFFLH